MFIAFPQDESKDGSPNGDGKKKRRKKKKEKKD